MESTGVIAGDIIVAGGYRNLVQALNRLTGEACAHSMQNTLYKVLRLSWMRSSTLRPIMLAMLWICILTNETIDFGYFSFAESEEIDLIQSHRERILDSLTEQTKTSREVTRNFAVWEWLKERLMARASEYIRHY